MKLDNSNSTDLYHFPVEETDAVMAYMAKAELTDSLASLKQGARLLMWLYRTFKHDTCKSDAPFDFEGSEFASVRQFNAAWKREAARKTTQLA